jgi:hypothetical protein
MTIAVRPKRRHTARGAPPTIASFAALPKICRKRAEAPHKILVPEGTRVILRWSVTGATSLKIEAIDRTGKTTIVRVPAKARAKGELEIEATAPRTYVLHAKNRAGEVRWPQPVDVATYRPSVKKAPRVERGAPDSAAVIGPPALPSPVHAPELLDFEQTSLRMTSLAREPDAFRQKVVQEVVQMDDFGIGDRPAGRKDAYGDIIAGTDPGARNDLLKPGPNASSCALAVRALWRFLGARDGAFAGSGRPTHLDRFRVGKVFQDVIDFAKRSGAWVEHRAGQDDFHPREGDVVVLYRQTDTAIRQHMFTIIHVEGDVYTSIDGGRGAPGSQADGLYNGIHRTQRTFQRGTTYRFAGDTRPILGWIDVTKIAFVDPIVELVKAPPSQQRQLGQLRQLLPMAVPLDEAGFFALASTTSFTHGSQIDAWFTAKTGSTFIDWFRAKCANQGNWAGKTIDATAEVEARFVSIWDNIPTFFGAPSCSLVQFLCLMSIFINEVGHTLEPRSEIFGSSSHPGISYLFDAIQGIKRSYNTATSNQTAYALFNDADFIAAHGALPMGSQLAHTTDERWRGSVYPSGVSTSGDPAVTGFILQADFFKYRGRGFIQTTFRSNYLPIIQWIQSYAGSQATIVKYRDRWRGLAPSKVATISTTQAWDELFQQSSFAAPAVAIHLHDAGAGGYLKISTDLATAKGTGAGSIFLMGKRISGGTAYANRFENRVLQTMTALRETIDSRSA